MESTGVYWIPVYQILEAHGFEVVLDNARHVHSVPGRKSDVTDCEWLRYHSASLLRGSFRPADEVCALRSVLRHRDALVKTASRSVLHMQKAYSQMNIHVHHAISDLTGVTGLAITDAILAGERDPARLAALADRRINASRATLIKALQGDWRAGAPSICWRCGTRERPMHTINSSLRSAIRKSKPASAPSKPAASLPARGPTTHRTREPATNRSRPPSQRPSGSTCVAT